MCVGASSARQGRAVVKLPECFTNLVQKLCALPSSCGCTGEFTSIQVNKNCQAELHVDKNNLGLSFIVTLGKFSSSELLVWNADVSWEKLDCHGKFSAFDGCLPHATTQFDGECFSIIYFMHKKFWKLENSEEDELQQVGF